MSSAYTLKSLKTELRKYGGKLSGKKSDLIARLNRIKTYTSTENDFPYGKYSKEYLSLCVKYNGGYLSERVKSNDQSLSERKYCDVDCCICMEKIFVDECKETECNHTFHKGCLDRWLEESSSCPLCRAQIGDKVVIQSIPDYYLDANENANDENELLLMNERIQECFDMLNEITTVEDLSPIENIDRLSYALATERLRLQLLDETTIEHYSAELYDMVNDHYYNIVQFERRIHNERS